MKRKNDKMSKAIDLEVYKDKTISLNDKTMQT